MTRPQPLATGKVAEARAFNAYIGLLDVGIDFPIDSIRLVLEQSTRPAFAATKLCQAGLPAKVLNGKITVRGVEI